jgi:hypothetical protein
MFGNAIHGALEDMFKSLKDREPSKEYLIARFNEHLKKEPAAGKDYVSLKRKGEIVLSAYFDRYHDEWNQSVITEFSVNGIELAPGTKIKGRMDKLEIVSMDGSVNVVDYKTGKAKTQGEVEGTTKNSDGNIRRQINFYKLLLDNYADGKYRMVSGEVDFIEPDEKGNFRKYKMAVADDSLEELKKQIIEVAEEIKTFSFKDKRCDDPECKWCSLRDMQVK